MASRKTAKQAIDSLVAKKAKGKSRLDDVDVRT